MANSKPHSHQGKIFIKKGDKVIITTGDDKGKTGDVISVLKEEYKVLVEGLNMVSRHTKPNAKNTNGGIIKKEAPIHLSNVSLIDPSTQKATRIRKERKDGKVTRISVKSGAIIK
jgi:large subunit ribosomal protein L24